MGGRPRALVVTGSIGMWLAACGPSAVIDSTAPPTSGASPTLAAPTSVHSAPGTEPGSSSVPIDRGLLALLPDSIDGLPVMPSPDSDVLAAADPAVVANGEGVVTALVVDPGAETFAYATLVRLRPGAFDEELYRSWRDSFDAGACERAGGVTGHAEAVIGDRQTFIGSCAGGVRTHHVWLPERRVLVSVSSAASVRLGEAMIEGLER